MTDDDKALVERLAAEADNFKVAREVDMRGMLYRAADRIEALSAENERLRGFATNKTDELANILEAGEHLK